MHAVNTGRHAVNTGRHAVNTGRHAVNTCRTVPPLGELGVLEAESCAHIMKGINVIYWVFFISAHEFGASGG